jgi:RNA polymerase sigma-70 factor (ECF subfamily)
VARANPDAVRAAVAEAHRAEWGRIVATLIRTTGDWSLAEECVADAFVLALERWPADSIPRSPGAWLTTTARHRAIDRLRRGATESRAVRELATLEAIRARTEEGEDMKIEDDRLRLIFTCCHPALALEARVALTLRTLAGLEVSEIARALLVSEDTMAKRLMRARAKIRAAGIPYRVPPAELLPERLSGVLAVLYLLALLYQRLAEIAPSPVVELNRAVAVARVDGFAAGLELVDRLEAAGSLPGYYLVPATRADLLRRLGRHSAAASAYRRALELVGTGTERRYLEQRLGEVSGRGGER